MKAIPWLVLIALATGAISAALARADVGGKVDARADVRALRQQIAQLQSRLKTLEARLAKLESSGPCAALRFETVPKAPNLPSLIVPPSRTGHQPKIWGQGEVNGWPFYFIPCGEP